jgi:hypothetical protein
VKRSVRRSRYPVTENGVLTKSSRKAYIDTKQRSLFNDEGISNSGLRTENIPTGDEALRGREISDDRRNVGYRPEYGTLPEVRIGFRDADSLRNRAVKAREERAGRLAAKGVRTSEEKGIDYALYNYAERDTVQSARGGVERLNLREALSKDFPESSKRVRIVAPSTDEQADIGKLLVNFNIKTIY